MKHRFVLAPIAIGMASAVHSAELARENFGDRREALSFRAQPDLSSSEGHFPSTFPPDFFGVTDRATAERIVAQHLLDDSINLPEDDFGVLRSTQRDPVFVIADTVNPANTIDPSIAEWTFDISGASGLWLSISVAAMGTFEGEAGPFADRIDFFAMIDGGAPQQLWHLTGDVSGEGFYTMESGARVRRPGPLVAGTTVLTNIPRQLVRTIDGTGSRLTIRLEASLDGANEVVVIETLSLNANAVSNPPTGACCTTGTSLCTDAVTPGDCSAPGLAFFVGGTCAEIECADSSLDVGACCEGGACTNNLIISDCAGEFSLDQGCDAIVCEVEPTGDIDESLAGCCLGGSCLNVATTKDICTRNGGSWFVGGDCGTTDPEGLGRPLCALVADIGACCDIDGCHLDVPRAFCEAGGAAFSEMNTCDLPCATGGGRCEGDANADRSVNVADFIAVLLNFGTAGPEGDANGDRSVNVGDFIAVLLHFGSPC